jgi:hypothetical protein
MASFWSGNGIDVNSMGKKQIQTFKTFEEAYADEINRAVERSPRDRILLLHRLIAAWMKFPRQLTPENEADIPVLKRKKNAS